MQSAAQARGDFGEDLEGLNELAEAFSRCKDAQLARRCVRVYVRPGQNGTPVIVFAWAWN